MYTKNIAPGAEVLADGSAGLQTKGDVTSYLPNNYYTTSVKPLNGKPLKDFDGKRIFTASYVTGRTFYKEVRDKHILKSPPAIAIQLSTFERLERLGIENVLVFNRDTGDEFLAPLGCFKTKGILIDRRYGKQIALPLKYWENTPKATFNFERGGEK